MTELTAHNDRSVDEYLASLDDDRTKQDSRVLIDMMQKISGHKPRLWNVGTIGFDAYHYKYDTGREGEAHAIGFYPRKNKLTIYLMDGTSRHAESLARLGKHTTSRVCVYVKRLSDIEMPVLDEILRHSYDNIMSQNGNVKRVVK